VVVAANWLRGRKGRKGCVVMWLGRGSVEVVVWVVAEGVYEHGRSRGGEEEEEEREEARGGEGAAGTNHHRTTTAKDHGGDSEGR